MFEEIHLCSQSNSCILCNVFQFDPPLSPLPFGLIRNLQLLLQSLTFHLNRILILEMRDSSDHSYLEKGFVTNEFLLISLHLIRVVPRSRRQSILELSVMHHRRFQGELKFTNLEGHLIRMPKAVSHAFSVLSVFCFCACSSSDFRADCETMYVSSISFSLFLYSRQIFCISFSFSFRAVTAVV